jgi:hypothetical protein
MSGALYSVPDTVSDCNRIFPAVYGFTVSVETARSGPVMLVEVYDSQRGCMGLM